MSTTRRPVHYRARRQNRILTLAQIKTHVAPHVCWGSRRSTPDCLVLDTEESIAIRFEHSRLFMKGLFESEVFNGMIEVHSYSKLIFKFCNLFFFAFIVLSVCCFGVILIILFVLVEWLSSLLFTM